MGIVSFLSHSFFFHHLVLFLLLLLLVVVVVVVVVVVIVVICNKNSPGQLSKAISLGGFKHHIHFSFIFMVQFVPQPATWQAKHICSIPAHNNRDACISNDGECLGLKGVKSSCFWRISSLAILQSMMSICQVEGGRCFQ